MIRVTPPTDQLLTVGEMKPHLNVMHDDDDLVIQDMIDAAVSWMDGWDGVLGRCIMPQTWRITASDYAAGFRLPDVTEATVDLDGSILATCAMPIDKLPSVRHAAKLLVAHWFRNREAVGDRIEMQPLSVRALLEPLRNA